MQLAKRHLWLFIALLALPYFLYAIYSYSQTDPNLVLSQNATYWSFQQQLWQLGYHMRVLSAQLYGGLILLMFCSYALFLRVARSSKVSNGKKLLVTLLIVLYFAYPALSHDLFNYMFNARMVVKYHVDPQVHTAMEFQSSDLWVRFMNNIDTPAPYGYGWTGLSVVPYIVGFNAFLSTYASFKLFMMLGFVLMFIVEGKLATELQDRDFESRKWLFFLNPLVLLEVIGTVHNDAWMMLPFFAAILFAFRLRAVKASAMQLKYLIASICLLIASISIKFATLITLPVYLPLLFSQSIPKKGMTFLHQYWADLGALLLFLPLLTDRSQQFHPWYLFWSLSFLPFIHSKLLRVALIALSLSSLLRYLPYLALGSYNPIEISQEKMITWIGGAVAFVALYAVDRLMKSRQHVRMNA